MDRVLIVDDERLIREKLSKWLLEEGYDPLECADGAHALREAAAAPPSLILLDLVMPGMSGLAVCQALKGERKTERIPIIVLTGAGSREDKIRCLEIGAEEFLRKPVDREELMARIGSILRTKHLGDRLHRSYMELDRLGTFAETIAGPGVGEWRSEDVAFNMARHFLEEGPDLVSRPLLTWGGYLVHKTLLGLTYFQRGGEWYKFLTRFPPRQMEDLLEPHLSGEGCYLSNDPPGQELRRLLRVPGALEIGNFAAAKLGSHVILAMGYPGRVDAYEIPLLRSLLRHWVVFERIRAEARQTEKAFFHTMEALSMAAELHDPNTAHHIRRVNSFAGTLASHLGCDAHFVRWISRCAQMHDVGKITIPLAILRKATLLDDGEFLIMKRHTLNGARILGDSSHMEMARNIARHHHENFDGTGYPDGLRGEQIPFEARILRVVDIYDALRTKRPYKSALAHEKAIQIIRTGDDRTRPENLDPRILEAFLDLHERMDTLYRDHSVPVARP